MTIDFTSTFLQVTIMIRWREFAVLLGACAIMLVGCGDDQVVDFGDGERDGPDIILLKPGNAIPGSYIVRLNDNVSEKELPSVAAEIAKVRTAEIGFTYGTAFRGFSARMSAKDAAALEKDSRVHSVEPDRYVALGRPPGKGKPDKGGDGDAGAPPQQIPWGVERVGGSATGSDVTVWVLDTGIDLDHPDLNVDVARSRNYSSGKNANDGNGHGTHVAGIIGAIDNTIGVVGVAAGVTLVPIRVLSNSGTGSYSGIIAGLDYVAANGSAGDVVNMSLGGPASSMLDLAVLRVVAKNIHVVVAAGNDGRDAANDSPGHLGSEQALVYTVSAHNSSDCLASWSNYGIDIDAAAPGVDILSTWKGGGTNTISGTSMAAPHVAGILALGSLGSDGVISCGDSDGIAEPIAHR